MRVRVYLAMLSAVAVALLCISPKTEAATIQLPDMIDIDLDLGTPTETRNSLGTFATYDGRDFGSIMDVDNLDATFRLLVDFASSASTDNHVIWETGAGTIGSSLVYVPSTSTLTFRQVSNNGNIILRVDQILSAAQVAAGDLDIVWTVDIDNGSGDPEIALWVDGILAGTDTSGSSQNTWSGSDGAGFGTFDNGVTAGGGNTFLPNAVPFGSAGAINTTEGLQFWADTHATLPEPSTYVVFGGLMACFGIAGWWRKRRKAA